MELPSIVTQAEDKKAQVKYKIVAYRSLTAWEVRQTVRIWLSQNKTPKRGTSVTIFTSIGAHD